MRKFFLTMGTVAGLLGLAGAGAQASPTTTSAPAWSYSFSPSPASIGTVGNNGSLSIAGAQSVPATGSSVVTLASLQLNSTATAADGSTLSSSAWSGTLTITDPSGSSGTLNLSGAFTGPMNSGQATPATFSTDNANVYFNPNSLQVSPQGSGWTTTMANGQVASYTWTAPDGNTYTIPVDDLSFTPPGIPNSSSGPGSSTQLNGAIAATIDVNGTGGASGNGGGNGGGTPEPSTLLLSCFGLGFAGLASWRQRRRRMAMQLA